MLGWTTELDRSWAAGQVLGGDLVFHGRLDRVLPVAHAEALASHIVGSSLTLSGSVPPYAIRCGIPAAHRRPSPPPPATNETAASGYSIRNPLIARAITSCWICSVPSKMS
jgi:hypothetical protein